MDASVVLSEGPTDHKSVSVVAEDETAHKLSGEIAKKRSGPADPMSVSVVAEAEIAHKLSGDPAEKRSAPADHMGLSVGEAGIQTAHKFSGKPEHPRVTRLRHRRLIAFLRDQGFLDSYSELTNKTLAHMSLMHLRGLVERGRWVDAVEYLDRYLPPPTSPMSFHAQVLRRFLLTHHCFADAVDGMGDKDLPKHYLQVQSGRAVSHAELRLRHISMSILAVDHVRANLDWQRVRDRASLVVSRLAHSAPELRGLIALPATSIKPDHVLPIASGLRSRRRYVKKKQTGRTQVIIRALKRQQLRVPSIGSVEEAKELLADLLDETVRSGVQLVTYCLSSPLQPGVNGGAQFCQPKFGTSTEAKTSWTSANEGINHYVVEAGCHTNTDSQVLDEKRNKLLRGLKRRGLTRAFDISTEAKTSGTLANAGTDQPGIQAGCHTNTDRQDLDETRSNLLPDLKRQRLTGTFGEASPVLSGPGSVVSGPPPVEETGGP